MKSLPLPRNQRRAASTRRGSTGFAASLIAVAGGLIALSAGVTAAGMDEQEHGGFEDVTERAGLTHTHRREPQTTIDHLFFTGGGAVGDFFGNGYPDLFFTRHDDTDILYKNMGDGTFEDRTEEVFGDQMMDAPTNGALMADLNNNGHLDLYVTASGGERNYFYVNDGFGRLIEQAEERGVLMPADEELLLGSMGMSVTAGDYTGDHYLDLFVSEWRSNEGGGRFPSRTEADLPEGWDRGSVRNRLFRNRGEEAPAYFDDVTLEAGLGRHTNHYGFSARFVDMNRNGVMDLLVANDWGNSEYYQGNGDGTFTEVAATMGTGTGTNEMGSTVADYTNNGHLDWFVTSIYNPTGPMTDGNRLYRNENHRGWPGVHFSDQTEAGVRRGHWGWGTSFIDHDNNGLRDLVMVNGYRHRYDRMPMKFWRNEGPDDRYLFTEIGEQIGLTDRGQGRGLIVADFFNNGQLDILVIKHAARPVLYRNRGGPNVWLRIETVGDTSHPMGIGAFITVKPDVDSDHLMVHDVNLGANFLSHNETIAHFGLGRHEGTVDYIRIEWPSGVEQEFYDIHPNQTITVHEADGIIDRSGPDSVAAGS